MESTPTIEMAVMTARNSTNPACGNSISPQSSANSVEGGAEPTTKEIEERPWKYIGYKGYSSFIASEPDFYILRRFASLNMRITLALHDQVTVLEEQLRILDDELSGKNADHFHNGSFRSDIETRTKLVEEIAIKLSKRARSPTIATG